VEPVRIRIGHSPDADDAFMFYALTQGKLDTGHLEIEHELQDIETLNHRCMRGELEVSAVSVHAYAYISDRYLLMPSGFSMGENYGPIVVSRQPVPHTQLQQTTIAVPGTLTTAFLALQLYCGGPVSYKVVPFDRILDAVLAGEADAGLVIHEGQLTYSRLRLNLVVDLGKWWQERTGLPLPLGANVIRRDLGRDTIAIVCRLLEQSIRYALSHEDEALDYALQFARGLNREDTRRFVKMYVNEHTLVAGPKERTAVQHLLREAYEKNLLPKRPKIEFADVVGE
jgi:1,4-dihydroxy-6-naphthoate synthase